ncbi:MAG: SIS domain-containing protein, partial [Candidatus Gastranaerophilales bacterium]|nr:SIS domain-containing protein [Candidatus Gastranaerophilales bacterium]
LKKGGKVLFCGNGGSASDSNHIAAEFVSRFMFDRNPLPAISLSCNQSVLTAIGNDYSFSDIFSRQIDALASNGDVVIGISTSGKSANVIKGFQKAKEKNLNTIFFSGENYDFEADCAICVPSCETSVIQEVHIMIAHIICGCVEEALFKKV